MIVYADYGRFICSGDPTAGGEQIPKDATCPAYRWVLAEVAAGRAEIVPQIRPGLSAGDREAVRNEIDTAAERSRLLFITAGAGQALTYQQKRAEADRFAESTAEERANGSFPLIDASLGIDGEDRAAVAARVRTTTAAWTALAATIERLRLGGKVAATAATTWAELEAAKTINWPAP